MCRARHLSRIPRLAGGGILRARNFISREIGKGVLFLIFFSFLGFPAGTGLTRILVQAQTATAIARVRDQYAGTAACAPCHKDKVISYQQTAHYLTSQLASKNSILGSFKAGTNELIIFDPKTAEENPGLYFKMAAHDDGFYETALIGWPGQFQERSARIDVVIGSGVRGQSYLSWRGDKLYELPVSYWSDGHKWINSPGYKNGTADFSRAVVPRCLECHSAYIAQRSPDPVSNVYERNSLVVGILCETCHGPGKAHVESETKARFGAGEPVAPHILNPGKFSRYREVDVCALCHNGIRGEQLAPAFSFAPGEQLTKYLLPESSDSAGTPNVHGNQVGLLEKSQCYLNSPDLRCSTCHDVHAQEKPAAAYSTYCLHCHSASSCGMYKTVGSKVAEDCIDCHMPIQETSAVVSDTAGELIRPKMRNHWIKVYR